MRRLSLLLLTLLSIGCEGSFGVRTRDGEGEGTPRLLGARDAGMPPIDARTAAADAWVTPGADARVPDAFVLATPDAYVAAPDAPIPSGCGTATEQAELALTNAARAMDGDGPLRCDTAMTAVARAHSQDMCDRNFFSHTNLDGLSPFQRMTAGGVSYSTAGENIAQGQRTPDEVHTAWMNSSGHRMNILNGAFGRIGIGLAECGGRMYWTQVFAN